MRISEVNAKLSGKDIISIIDQYVHIKDLNIYSIDINEFVEVCGTYTKGVKVPFKVIVAIGSIYDNMISLKVASIKAYKVGIMSFIKNYALKKIVESLKQAGIQVKEDNIILDLNVILKAIPFIDFKLRSIQIRQQYLEADVCDLSFTLEKVVEKVELPEEEESDEEEYIDLDNMNIEKIRDGYTKARESIQHKVSCEYKPVLQWAMVIPDILALVYRLFKDKRVKLKTKVVVAASAAYLVSPIDILPDKVPFIGKVDDLGVAFFALNKIINDVPINIVLENWQGENNIMLVLKEALSYFNKISSGSNVERLYKVIENLA